MRVTLFVGKSFSTSVTLTSSLLITSKVSKSGFFSSPYFPGFVLNMAIYFIKSPYSVQMWKNKDQIKLKIWTLFTHWLSKL